MIDGNEIVLRAPLLSPEPPYGQWEEFDEALSEAFRARRTVVEIQLCRQDYDAVVDYGRAFLVWLREARERGQIECDPIADVEPRREDISYNDQNTALAVPIWLGKRSVLILLQEEP
jgi:hypothetical protein